MKFGGAFRPTKIYFEMDSSLIIAFIFSAITLLVKIMISVWVYLITLKRPPVPSIEDVIENAFVLIAQFLISFGFLELVQSFVLFDNGATVYLAAIMIGSIPLCYSFLLHPLYYMFFGKTFSIEQDQAQIISMLAGKEKINIRVINKMYVNAYATGVIPFTKVILITKGALGQLTDDELQCLFYHEVGHLRKHHLFILFSVNFLFLVICMVIYLNISHWLTSLYLPPIWVGLYWGLVYGGFGLFLSGFTQRELELEADHYASVRVGKEVYQKFLINLNKLTDEGLEKWAVNYPSLSERLRNVAVHQ